LINGRQKGAAFERQIAGMLFDEIGIKFQRDIEQYRQSQLCDLRPIDCDDWPFAIECKRYASGNTYKPEWWGQTCLAASRSNLEPALIYKYDRAPIRCVVSLQALAMSVGKDVNIGWIKTAELDFDTFCYVARELMCVQDTKDQPT